MGVQLFCVFVVLAIFVVILVLVLPLAVLFQTT